jgi:DNA-binding winged helix-turn-helix (wHTH) protein/tetratricopeptide (TPR) repeat protein
MGNGIKRFYEFGPFRIDPARELLLRSDELVPLTSKAFQTLLVLVENSDQVVPKDQLMRTLWPGTFVEESNLTKHISMVRKALGQTAQEHGYIVTVPGVGYRFAETVRVVSVNGGAPPVTAVEAPPPVSEVLPPGVRRKRRAEWIAATLVFLIAAGILVDSLYRHPHPAEPLTEKDTVLLIDFLNSTGDAVFDDTLKQALSVSLNQSPFLNVLSENKVAATLRMMARPEGKLLSPDLARELCQRAGGKAYIAGSIANLGNQYVVGLKAVNCANGDTLAQEQASAAAKERVLDALGVAAAKLRGELGESLATVQRFDVPLQQATTSSLEALRAYSLGRKEAGEQGPRVALPYDLHAVELDPNFAMGYFAVGYDYFILGEVGKASEYFTKAFELGKQVSEREKLTIAAAYYQSVTGELDKATQTYKEQIASYPRDYRAHLDLSIVYGQQGQYEDAIAEVREAARLAPDDVATYGVLSYDLLASQRVEEAEQVGRQAQGRKLDDFVLRQILYTLAFLRSDSSGMEEQAAWFTGKAAVENSGLSLESDTSAYRGHMRRAQELTAQAVDSAMRNGHKESAAIWEANAAVRAAGMGNVAEAHRMADAALKLLPTGQAVKIETALALAMAGDTVRTTSLAQDLNRRFPLDTQVQSLWLPTIEGQLALDGGDAAAALNRLHAVAAMDMASIQFLVNVSCLYPVYVRGEAYLAAGNGSAAASEFERILDHSGITWNCWTGALAKLGLARAYALEADAAGGLKVKQSSAVADHAADPAALAKARSAYQDFFTLWKDADPDIPVLREARAEFAKLQ